jgi:hypothetical protein
MIRPAALLFAAAAFAAAAPMNYTLTGTGSGYWNSQPFTNAAFTFTFSSDTGTIVHGTSCCGAIYSTPSGTTATVSVAGFSSAELIGDQAIFLDNANNTAGIWHFNAAQYLTVTNAVFANADLTTPREPRSGVAWAYATPFPLSSGGSLYFTSVQNVNYSQGPPFGVPYTTSVTPSSGSQALNTTQTYTFVVGDSIGLSDLSGVDIQFRWACWLFFDPASNRIAITRQGTWGPLTPIGSGGSTLTGDACTVDTAAITATPSGNNLTLAIPIQITAGDNNTLPIFASAQNKEDGTSGYTQLGTVTVQGSGNSQKTFTLSVSPGIDQAAPAGASTNYSVTLSDQNGFNEPVTFSASATTRYIYFEGQPYGADGDPSQLSFAFNPTTLTTSGTTTMTVTSTGAAPPADYNITITGTAQTEQHTATAELTVQNGPPQLTLTPASGSGSSATLTITWPDYVNVPSSINLLVAPSLDGGHACWIYFDAANAEVYLASDDGLSWTDAYHLQTNPFGDQTTGPGASNSQCTFAGKPNWRIDPPDPSLHLGHNTLTIPLTFTPAFNGSKTVFTRASNAAGFDSGYQSMGGWVVQ